jgi:hypothetical protein
MAGANFGRRRFSGMGGGDFWTAAIFGNGRGQAPPLQFNGELIIFAKIFFLFSEKKHVT